MGFFIRGALMCALTTIGLMGTAEQSIADEITREEALQALETSDWETAITAYRAFVEKNDKDYDSWFYLGYALHASGQLEKAIEGHRKAAASPRFGAVAVYNHACALALLGKPEEALTKLEEAVKAGFNNAAQLQGDPDMDSLRDTPRFKKILTALGSPPPPPAARRRRTPSTEFNFWIGEWNVVGKNGKTLGTNRITSSQNGFLLTENWTSANGGTGTSINFFDASSEKWMQTWVDAAGGVTYYQGEFKDGKMQFAGPAVQPDGTVLQSRMVFTPNDDGSVGQFIEQSKDEGKTWTVYFDGKYVPTGRKAESSE